MITASHSFIATANSIRYCGATPVFVDIDPDTYNIDPARVAEAITPRTRAILAVHQMGMPCDLPALAAMADRHGIALIEDAACAAGSEIRIDGQWERIGKPHGRYRLLFVPPAQGDHDRRRRHADDLQSRFRPQVQAAAPARHERPGHGAARVATGHLRGLSRRSASTTG